MKLYQRFITPILLGTVALLTRPEPSTTFPVVKLPPGPGDGDPPDVFKARTRLAAKQLDDEIAYMQKHHNI